MAFCCFFFLFFFRAELRHQLLLLLLLAPWSARQRIYTPPCSIWSDPQTGNIRTAPHIRRMRHILYSRECSSLAAATGMFTPVEPGLVTGAFFFAPRRDLRHVPRQRIPDGLMAWQDGRCLFRRLTRVHEDDFCYTICNLTFCIATFAGEKKKPLEG